MSARFGFRRRGRLAAALALPLLLLLTAGCTGDPQDTLTRDGDLSDRITSLFRLTFIIAAVIFVLVEGALVYIVFRYRRRQTDTELPAQTHGSTPLEITWTIIPVVILGVLAVPTLRDIQYLNDTPDDALVVNVTAQQWWWAFDYPEQGVVTADEMVIPAGRPIRVVLQSKDVIHSFWVPKLAGKMDVVPSNNPKQRLNEMWFNAKEPGTYQGQCAEFCALSHAKMKFAVRAVTPSEFDTWVQQQRQPAPAMTGAALQGQQTFNGLPCIACHTINGTVAQGTLGPNLTHFASRPKFAGNWLDNNTENLRAWLADPASIKPGSKMPNYNLTEQQITELIAYLQALR